MLTLSLLKWKKKPQRPEERDLEKERGEGILLSGLSRQNKAQMKVVSNGVIREFWMRFEF